MAVIDARVVFLTHYIPLYQVRVLQSIARSVAHFQVLVSTPIEPNRDFAPDWSGLNVTVQDTWTLRRQWRHRGHGSFADSLYIHVPYDTTRQLTAINPDVVMSLELGARSFGAAKYCRRSGAKLILCTYMSERTEQSRGRLRHYLRRHLLKSADAVTYNGPSCRRYLERFDIGPDRLFPLPYAADDRTLYRGPLERDEAQTRGRFLIIGQLSQRKGVVPLVHQAAQYVRKHPGRPIELWFAGDGPQRDEIAAIDAPPGLVVRLLGNVPANDLSGVMRQCSALIAPTLADEWMLVVNEGLQAGLPVIGSVHSQAVMTLVQNDVNGWRYDPAVQDDRHASFEAAVDRYFDTDRLELAAMRPTCRTSVSERTPTWAARGAVDAIAEVTGLDRDASTATSPMRIDAQDVDPFPPSSYAGGATAGLRTRRGRSGVKNRSSSV